MKNLSNTVLFLTTTIILIGCQKQDEAGAESSLGSLQSKKKLAITYTPKLLHIHIDFYA